jgi:hypothetical protein
MLIEPTRIFFDGLVAIQASAHPWSLHARARVSRIPTVALSNRAHKLSRARRAR